MNNPFSKLFRKKASDGGEISFVQFLQQLSKGRTNLYTEWVYAGFSKVAYSLARVEWQLFQVAKNGDAKEVQDSHPLLGLLYRFNGKSTRFDAMAKTILGFLTDGEVGWYIGERKGNKPISIHVIMRAGYKVTKKDEFENVVGYGLKQGNDWKEIPATDLLVIKNVNPSGNDGYPVLSALKDVAETDWFISQWNKNLMKNDGSMSAIVKVPGALDAKQSAILRKQVEDTYAGYENAHKIAVLGNGAEIVNNSVNPKDADFINGRSFNRDLILSIIGAPKTILGLDNGVTKATAETAERIFAKYTLEPIMEQVIEWLNEYLVPTFGDNLWLMFKPFATEDSEQKLNETDKGYNRWLTTNEARAQYGFDPIVGGDSIYMPIINVPMLGGSKSAGDQKGYIEIKAKVSTEKKIASVKAFYIKTRVQNRTAYKNLLADAMASGVGDKLNKKNQDNTKVILKIGAPAEKKELMADNKLRAWETIIMEKRSFDEHLAPLFKQIFQRQKKIILDNLKKLDDEKKLDEKLKANKDEVIKKIDDALNG